MFDKMYLIKTISAVTNYNSSSCLKTGQKRIKYNLQRIFVTTLPLKQITNEQADLMTDSPWTINRTIPYFIVILWWEKISGFNCLIHRVNAIFFVLFRFINLQMVDWLIHCNVDNWVLQDKFLKEIWNF